jgi:hypothetical protein
MFEARNKVARGQMNEITVPGGSGGDLFAATTTGKAREGKAIATLSAQPRMTCLN